MPNQIWNLASVIRAAPDVPPPSEEDARDARLDDMWSSHLVLAASANRAGVNLRGATR